MEKLNKKRVKTKNGNILGTEKDGCYLYKGVPYALPPTGERRYKKPVTDFTWDNELETTSFSGKCPQTGSDPKGFYYKEFHDDEAFYVENSEDCLSLNIWKPENADGKCPVAFWIHGGAFVHGTGGEQEFDGKAYCEQGVILVTINYRLGVLGFLRHEWLMEDGCDGNFGILDQIAALKWVYENIEAFGGDKNNITVFGQSAGGMSTQILTSTDMTKNMIAKAIMQSGGGYENMFTAFASAEDARKAGERFLEFASINSIEELKSISFKELVDKADEFAKVTLNEGELGLIFSPSIDDYIFKDNLDTLIKNNKIHDIPYMVGCCKNDIFCEEGAEKPDDNPLYAGFKNFADSRKGQSDKPIYVYYFTRDLPGDEAGAFHSSELWYMFGTLVRCWRPFTPDDYTLSNDMITAWTDFMKESNPGKNISWDEYNLSQKNIKVFDIAKS